ncbi:MAG TPA: hypothetical protein VL088_14980 [Pedobacter sp.]|nr:hypothetical protein [Pedobacter sp.]
MYDHWHADIAQASDYYPGGMIMPGRYKEYDWSRMGNQSQQKDDEVYGKGNLYAYKYRMNDARINRFFSPDPLHAKYPNNSDYAFSQNRLIDAFELEGLESVSIHLRSFISAQYTFDPLNRKFEGDNRGASVERGATARGRAQLDYDFPTNQVKLKAAYADPTYRYNIFGSGKTSAIGKVKYNMLTGASGNGKKIELHYETQNPLTPSAFTPTVDVDANYTINYDKVSNAWNISFDAKSDGYPSTESFIEDPSGQKIMLGFKYEKGTPGSQLFGEADTEVFKGKVKVTLDKDYNFQSATTDKGGVLPIVPAKTKSE